MTDRLNWLNTYDKEHPTQTIQPEAKQTLQNIVKELS
jgi:phosphoenolpyruvate carboxykinase (ATP)